MARLSRPIFQNLDKAKVEGETLTEAGSGRGGGRSTLYDLPQ